MKPNQNSRIDSLTSIRAFAALLVVFYHVWGYFLPLEQDSWLYSHMINIGYIGVNFFFILSGYILSYVYIGVSKRPVIEKSRFWKSRFARIYPVYLLSFALEMPIFIQDVFLRHNSLREALTGVSTLLANLLFLQSWVPVLCWRWNYASWTLSTEAFFYLLFPILGVWLWKRTKDQSLPLIIFGVYSLLMAPSLFLWAGHLTPNNSSLDWIFMNPILRVPEFLLGMFLFKWQKSFLSQKKKESSRLLIGLGILTLIIGFAASGLIPVLVLRGGIFDPAFMCLIAGIALSEDISPSLLTAGPLVLLGEASYSIYILQAPLKEWLTMIAFHFQIVFSGKDNHPMLFGVYLLTLIGASLLSYQYLETPLREKIKNLKFKLSRRGVQKQNK